MWKLYTCTCRCLFRRRLWALIDWLGRLDGRSPKPGELLQWLCHNDCTINNAVAITTRKLCYRKDDSAMRPINGCPENFRDSLTTPTATIPNIFQELLFGSTLWMFLQNLKFVALSVPQIRGGTLKIWTVPGYALAPFSPKFLIGFYSDWPYKCTRQISSPYLYPFPR